MAKAVRGQLRLAKAHNKLPQGLVPEPDHIVRSDAQRTQALGFQGSQGVAAEWAQATGDARSE